MGSLCFSNTEQKQENGKIYQLSLLIRFRIFVGHLITNKLNDSFDVLKRRTDFIGQVNNMFCHFRNLNSCVKFSFFSLTV